LCLAYLTVEAGHRVERLVEGVSTVQIEIGKFHADEGRVGERMKLVLTGKDLQ